MSTPLRRAAGALAVAALLLLEACATLAPRSLAAPGGARLYVAPFVDETASGSLGLRLADEVRREIWSRSPGLLSPVFDEGTLALDGTILAVETSREGRGVSVAVRAAARLVAQSGETVAELGAVDAVGDVGPGLAGGEGEALRAQALREALRGVARALVDRIDRAARTAGS